MAKNNILDSQIEYFFDYKNILNLTAVKYVFGLDLSQKSQPQPLLKQKHIQLLQCYCNVNIIVYIRRDRKHT